MRLTFSFFAAVCALLCFSAGCGQKGHTPAPTVQPVATAAVGSPNPVSSPGGSKAASPDSDSQAKIHFAGEVKRGEPFVQKVAPNLVFRLNPNAGGDSGWRIEILPDTLPLPQDFDCSGSVTPPAHGPNDLFLEKPDGINADKIVQWNPHQFNFVANAADCKLAWDLFNEEEYPSNLTEKQKEADEQRFSRIPTGSGTLKVLDARLSPPSETDEFGAILWLKFEVELEFPRLPKAP